MQTVSVFFFACIWNIYFVDCSLGLRFLDYLLKRHAKSGCHLQWFQWLIFSHSLGPASKRPCKMVTLVLHSFLLMSKQQWRGTTYSFLPFFPWKSAMGSTLRFGGATLSVEGAAPESFCIASWSAYRKLVASKTDNDTCGALCVSFWRIAWRVVRIPGYCWGQNQACNNAAYGKCWKWARFEKVQGSFRFGSQNMRKLKGIKTTVMAIWLLWDRWRELLELHILWCWSIH